MTEAQDIFPDRAALDRLCREFHVAELDVFGSIARGEATPESDVDLLVSFAEGHEPDFFTFGQLADELAALTDPPRKVDLVPPDGLHPDLAAIVQQEMCPLYRRRQLAGATSAR